MKYLLFLLVSAVLTVGCSNYSSTSEDSERDFSEGLEQNISSFEKTSSADTLLSQNKPSKQSSIRAGQSSRLAFDGNKSTKNNMQTERMDQPWLEVDLQKNYDLSYVNVFNRNSMPKNYASRLRNYYIFVSDSPFRSQTVDALRKESGVTALFQSAQAGFPSRINIGKSGRYVRIQLSTRDLLHLTELEVYGKSVSSSPQTPPVVSNPAPTQPKSSDGKVTLLSRNKPSKQSSVRGTQSSRLAFDGNKGTSNNMQTERADQPWLEVDLQKSYNLSHVDVYNRNSVPKNYASRLKNYYVFVSDNPFRSQTVDALKRESGVTALFQSAQAGFPSRINIGKSGRYVRIQLSTRDLLHLTELEVFGTGGGSSSTIPPVVSNPPPVTPVPTPTPPKSSDGKVVLLSKNKPSKQSSVRGTQSSRLAFDGNKGTSNNMQTERADQPWLEVDLQKSYNLSHVDVYNRNSVPKNYASRLKNYYVFVSDNPFRSQTVDALKRESGVTALFQSAQAGFPSRVNIGKSGRYVRIQLSTRDLLHLTELEVFGSGGSADKDNGTGSGDPLKINLIAAQDILSGSFKVRWELSRNSTGVVEYGTSSSVLNKKTATISHFNSSTHIMAVTGLSPVTTYYFRAVSVDKNGDRIISKTLNITTKAGSGGGGSSPPTTNPSNPPVIAKGWPKNTNQNLPMSGIFYGTPVGGLQTGNSTTAIEHSVRFRATRTASIKAVKWENRLLNKANINTRSTTKHCRDNGLDEYSCGYTLGNAYHVGNGGKIVAVIHPDNGKGRPNERVVLGEVARPFIPMNNPSSAYISQPLKRPVPLVAGRLYHIRLKNLAPPKLPLYRNSVAQARSKNRNTGAMGFNGVWIGRNNAHSAALRWGPYLGQQGIGVFYRNDTKGSWQERTDVIPRIEYQYSDGKWAGQVYAGYDNITYGKPVHYRAYDGFKIVEGARRIRQVFKVTDVNRTVNGMWLNFGHTYSASLASMQVTLKDSSNRTLATGSIRSSSKVRDLALKAQRERSSDLNLLNSKDWGYTNLSKEVTLVVGRTYYLEMNAPSKAGFHINSFFPHHGNNRDLWNNSHAEVNHGNGKGWERFDKTNGWAGRDLPILFTLKGMPKQLP